MNFADLKVGNTITFVYHAGSNPGSTRNVLISDIDSWHQNVTGTDLDIDEIRCFNYWNMSNINLKEDKSMISFVEARKQIEQSMTGEQLAKVYTEVMGVEVKWDSKSGSLKKVVKEPYFMNIAEGKNSDDMVAGFDIVNSDCDTLSIGINDGEIEIDGISCNDPLELLKKLQEHLNA